MNGSGDTDGGEKNEIRLADLVRIFAGRGPLMAAMLGLSLATALVFLWWASPVYRAELILLPPLEQDVILRDSRGIAVSSMNLGRFKFRDYTPKQVYEEIQVNLRSRSLRREFFDREDVYEQYVRVLDRGEWSPLGVFEEQFDTDLQIHEPGPGQSDVFVRVNFELHDPAQVAELLNSYVAAIDRYTVRELFEPVRLRLRGQVREVEIQIARSRESALMSIDDQLTQLAEAAELAKSLGLIDSIPPPGLMRDFPYRRGEKVLRAEMLALEKRKGDDAFIPGLRKLQDKLTDLLAIELDLEQMRAARVDQAALVPDGPVFPRYTLVLAIALVAGVLLAFTAAVAHDAWQRMQAELD